MKKSKKKHSFSLVELLIGLVLFSFLLSFFLGLFFQISRFEISLKGKINKAENIRLAGARLQTIFSNIAFTKNDLKLFYLKPAESRFEKGESLIFTYDNQIDPSPYFSNNVVAKLFLDKHDRLVFAIFPNPNLFIFEKCPLRSEVILENVESYKMKFFLSRQQPENAQKEPKSCEWINEWNKEFGELPSLVKIVVKFKSGDDVTFVEMLPKTLSTFTFK